MTKGRPLRVMKFGGTSVGDADCIGRVAGLVADEAAHSEAVVVVSATQASRGDRENWKGARQELARRHREVADRLLGAAEQAQVLPRLAEEIGDFENLCSGFSLVREITPRGMDALSSLGEKMSAVLVAAALRSRGCAAEAVDATEMIVTDDHFGNASPYFDETTVKTRDRLAHLRRRGMVPVVTGFRAATREGVCTTLGRGGSDYSATLVGAALEADEIWIWTDVDGVMTADPRLVPSAHIVPEVSYREAAELAYFGAKVLHPKTIQPVVKRQIPVWIKNTFNPTCPGTRIDASSTDSRPGVKALTTVSKAALITVSGRDRLGFSELAARVFESLSREDIPTLMVTQSSADNVLCFAVHDADLLRVRDALEKAFELEIVHDYIGAPEVLPRVAIVVAVGENMRGMPGLSGRAFSALGRQGINIIAIAQGSSELSISLAVRSGDVKNAVTAIHEEFEL
jgi:aspartokinase/homoserine dehydrogenase 1